MIKSRHLEVQLFLEGILLSDPELSNSLVELREVVFKTHPKLEEKIMYGGIVFSMNEKMFGGVFLNKKHVSLEFSNGYLMEDPNSHLEGKGKFRRHLKIRKGEDVINKEVAFYVKQALSE